MEVETSLSIATDLNRLDQNSMIEVNFYLSASETKRIWLTSVMKTCSS